jgi:hypothetical protein
VSNWTDQSPGWRRISVTANAGGSRLLLYLDNVGDVYVDDISLVEGSIPENGPNLVQNGDFETDLSGPWIVSGTNANSAISTDFSHAGNSSLHLFANGQGAAATNRSIWQDLVIVTNSQYTLSLWYLPTTNANTLTARLNLGGVVVGRSVHPILYTPGAANTAAASLPPYDPLWLNEVQPQNVNGPLDNFGAHEPWLELYNAGSAPLSLDGYYLSDNYSNLTVWPFPPGTLINPGEFKLIWADGQPAQTTATDLHTSFRLSPTDGSLALSRLLSGQPQIVDYLNYSGMGPNLSYGDLPDGQPFDRQIFYTATPRAGNFAPPLTVFINEWMASNTRTITNVDNASKFDDWFEIYNASDIPADLGGYYLTDTLTNKFQFHIPAGYIIAPHGYLLVWADGLPNLNSPTRPDLHVNFNLAKGGEEIGLFAADGTPIDTVTFGAQVSDVSQGRFPDGAATISFLVTPTPGGPNSTAGNTAPALDPINNRNINELSLLSIQATATDPDAGQSLTFTLDPVVPLGASITSGGLFRWRPSEAQGPGTYTINVRVTDNGTPPASDVKSFTVTVNEVNSPPFFLDTRAKYVKAGSLLSFATATDADLPPQTLSFSLGAGAPSGVNLNPVSGLFTWTPNDAQVSNIPYPVTVQVSDNGIPPISNAYTYSIHVAPSGATLIAVDISQTGATINLRWTATVGKTYRIQYKADIEAPDWTDSGLTLVAGSTSMLFSEPISHAHRFYRILQVD